MGEIQGLCSGFALFSYPTLGELQRLLLQLVGDLGKDPKAMEISFPLRLNGLIKSCMVSWTCTFLLDLCSRA